MTYMDMMDSGARGQAGNPARWGQLYVGFKLSTKLQEAMMTQQSTMQNSFVVNYLIHASSFSG